MQYETELYIEYGKRYKVKKLIKLLEAINKNQEEELNKFHNTKDVYKYLIVPEKLFNQTKKITLCH